MNIEEYTLIRKSNQKDVDSSIWLRADDTQNNYEEKLIEVKE